MIKRIAALFIPVVIFTGCVKPLNTPVPLTDSTTLLHTVYLGALPQKAQMSVKDSTLTILFTENINVMLTPKGLDQSWAVHLYEDFSPSALVKFNYTTLAENGNTTYDWVDDNLNNVILKTVSDTTYNGIVMKDVHVIRNFTMFKQYANVSTALNAESTLLKTETDFVKFSSHVFFGIDYPTTSISSPVVYSEVTNK